MIYSKSPDAQVAELGEDLDVLNVCLVIYTSRSLKKFSFPLYIECLQFSLNPLCLNCVWDCETLYKISFLCVFVLCMLLAKRGGKLAKTQVFYLHLEAGFEDLGQNSGPTEINGKTSVGQNFTPGNWAKVSPPLKLRTETCFQQDIICYYLFHSSSKKEFCSLFSQLFMRNKNKNNCQFHFTNIWIQRSIN